jgi:C4-dicarboxylate transporter DctQ subunit
MQKHEVVSFNLLDRVEEILISLFLGLSTLLVFSQVVARYVFNTGIIWAPELVEYLFLWSVMIGASYGVKQGVHLGVDILVTKFGPVVHRWVVLMAVFLSICFSAGMTYLSFFYVRENYRMGLMSVDMGIPKWLPNLALPVGFALITIRFLQVGWRVYTGQCHAITKSGQQEPVSSEGNSPEFR